METVINTAEAKQKLRNGGVMSGHIDEFCRVLALRLNDEITPLGFLMAFELLINDMEKAHGRKITWGGQGEGIDTYIAGLPIGNVVRMMQKKIVKHAFPEDFANEVIDEWDAVINDAADAFKASRGGRY
jgi:hypothetical protein